jgi:streptogramin lyase
VRIDPQAGKVVGEPIRIPGAVPLDLVAGDGVWVTDSGGALPLGPGSRGGVTRVDPATRKITSPALSVGKRPSAIALGAGGLWITNEDSGTLTPIMVAKRRCTPRSRPSRRPRSPRRRRAPPDERSTGENTLRQAAQPRTDRRRPAASLVDAKPTTWMS